MKKILTIIALCSLLQAKTELVVSYAYAWFKPLHEKLKEEFEKQNPDISITFLAPTQNYEEQSARLLREKVINKLPDVSFNSYAYLPTLVDKNIPHELHPSNAQDFGEGIKTTTLGGKIYALPFAISMPVTYYNEDLIRQAGWVGELPKTWDEIFALCEKVNGLEGKSCMYFAETDTWLILALALQRGGALLNAQNKADFSTPAWLDTFKILSEFHSRAKMPSVKKSEALTSFNAGNLALLVQTSAALVQTEKAVNFTLKLGKFPQVKEGGKLPVGGSLVMLTSDKNKEAALKYIDFVTGWGNQFVPQFTGYMSVNSKAHAQLGEFYAQNPNAKVAPSQLPLLVEWPSFPGNNALKATNILWLSAEKLLLGKSTDYEGVARKATEDINRILP